MPTRAAPSLASASGCAAGCCAMPRLSSSEPAGSRRSPAGCSRSGAIGSTSFRSRRGRRSRSGAARTIPSRLLAGAQEAARRTRERRESDSACPTDMSSIPADTTHARMSPRSCGRLPSSPERIDRRASRPTRRGRRGSCLPVPRPTIGPRWLGPPPGKAWARRSPMPRGSTTRASRRSSVARGRSCCRPSATGRAWPPSRRSPAGHPSSPLRSAPCRRSSGPPGSSSSRATRAGWPPLSPRPTRTIASRGSSPRLLVREQRRMGARGPT